MNSEHEKIRRGLVMTGGGAKGLYEAGVIHAFHLCAMDFHVITGSSIGAMNAVFYAEYLYRKRGLPASLQADPERALEALDELVRAFLNAWWQAPERGIIDDSGEGPLGRLKDDLEKFNLNLPELTRLLWWWSDPQRGRVPPPVVGLALARLFAELSERLEGWGELLRIFKDHRAELLQEAARSYLKRFGMESSLVPEGADEMLTTFFTEPVEPMTAKGANNAKDAKGAKDANNAKEAKGGKGIRLVERGRTLGDYYERAGVDVRLTRVNYRTGRLEISAYLSDEAFAAYLVKQSKRTGSEAIEALPVGAFRLQNPGNPDAVRAALASGRFPGVFKPYPLSALYDLERPENRLLRLMLLDWLDDPEAQERLCAAYAGLDPSRPDPQAAWQELLERWQGSEMMREYFPKTGDIYVDGGAVDNTPSNTAVDSVCEWALRQGVPRGDLELDLYEVLLHPEPKVSVSEAHDPAFFDVVARTLAIQGAARLSSESAAVQNINTFGRRGREAVKVLLAAVRAVRPVFETLGEGQQRLVEQSFMEQAAAQGLDELAQDGRAGILERIEQWASALVERLPMQVNLVRIHPDEMKLETLQFTPRLGYRPERALEALTMGCSNTLWALRRHLEQRQREYTRQGRSLNEHDQTALRLARHWMGFEIFPESARQQDFLEPAWRCTRSRCVFYERACRRGARQED